MLILRNRHVVILVAVLMMVVNLSLGAHLAATKTVPAQGAVLVDSPTHLQVWFTQEPDASVSRLTLEGPDGAIEIGETLVIKEKSLWAAVSRPLSSGAYTLKWRTAGDDGHVRRGSVTFQLSAAD